MAKEHEKKVVKRRKPVTERNRKQLVATLLVNAEAALRVAAVFEPEYLDSWHPGYAELWRVCRDCYLKKGKLPTRTVLRAEFDEATQAASDLDEEYITEAVDLLRRAHGNKEELGNKENASWAVSMAQRIAEEAVLSIVKSEIEISDDIPENLAELIASWQTDAQRARASSAAKVGELFASGYVTRKNVQRSTTYQDVLDKACGGQGDAPGWINVFGAPLGYGKTDLCSSTCALFAKNVKHQVGEPVPVAVIFSFETALPEFEVRLLAHCAGVPKDRIVECDRAELRGLGQQPLKYERERFSGTLDAGKPIPPEQERVRKAVALMRKHIKMIDVSRMDAEADENAETQTSVDMMVATIKRIEDEGNKVIVVWIDHASAMIDDMLAKEEFSGDAKSRRTELLRGMPRLLRTRIATPFSAKVWLLAQLSGEANSRAATSELSYTDMEGCKLLMMYADNAILAGRHTAERLSIWWVDKHRHNEKPPPFIVRFDGAFADFRDVTDFYEIDTAARQIVSKEQAAKAHAAREPEKAKGRLHHTDGIDY